MDTLELFLTNVDFAALAVADVAILVFSFKAYSRSRLPAFWFLIVGSALSLVLGIGFQIENMASNPPFDLVAFRKFYRALYILAILCSAIGTVQLIRHVVKKLEKNEPAA